MEPWRPAEANHFFLSLPKRFLVPEEPLSGLTIPARNSSASTMSVPKGRERLLQADASAVFGAHSGPEQSEPLALTDHSLPIAQPVPTLTLVHSKAKKPHSESVLPSGCVVGDQMELFG